jgi:copper resistance protein B
MRMAPLIAAAIVALPAIASGQTMAGMQMPGMTAPKAKPAPPPPRKAATSPPRKKTSPAGRPASAHQHGGAMPAMEMGASPPPSTLAPMPGMTMPADQPAHAGHDMTAMPRMEGMGGKTAVGTDLPAGNAPPPPVRHDRSADPFYGAPAMAEAEARMMGAHGGAAYHQILFNLAEYQARRGHDGYRWSGDAWVGGDLDRLVVKSEGEGSFHERIDTADVQALYSRAIDPYWNLQAGVRQSFQPGPNRPYAVLSIEGLAPYWLEVEGALFLSGKGDLLARAEAHYDQRITQRVILQPRAELNFAAQNVPENRIGAGLSDIELGLRLCYEIRREFAPYVGVSWERRVGDTARFARAVGDDVRSTSFVAGIRFWF